MSSGIAISSVDGNEGSVLPLNSSCNNEALSLRSLSSSICCGVIPTAPAKMGAIFFPRVQFSYGGSARLDNVFIATTWNKKGDETITGQMRISGPTRENPNTTLCHQEPQPRLVLILELTASERLSVSLLVPALWFQLVEF
jgi:hypothetical protein